MRPLARANRELSDCRIASLSRAFFLFLPFSLCPSSCPPLPTPSSSSVLLTLPLFIGPLYRECSSHLLFPFTSFFLLQSIYSIKLSSSSFSRSSPLCFHTISYPQKMFVPMSRLSRATIFVINSNSYACNKIVR